MNTDRLSTETTMIEKAREFVRDKAHPLVVDEYSLNHVADIVAAAVKDERERLKESLNKLMSKSQSQSFYEWWNEEFGSDQLVGKGGGE